MPPRFGLYQRVSNALLVETQPRLKIRELTEAHGPLQESLPPERKAHRRSVTDTQPELPRRPYPNHVQFFVSLHKLFFQFHNLCHGFVLRILELFRQLSFERERHYLSG